MNEQTNASCFLDAIFTKTVKTNPSFIVLLKRALNLWIKKIVCLSLTSLKRKEIALN